MPVHMIRHAGTARAMAVIEAPTYAQALEWWVRRDRSLMDADLSRRDLRGAYLAGADLRFATLAGSDLRGAYLRRSSLFGADLRAARGVNACLAGADLRNTLLQHADLSSADLAGAILVGADLRECLLVNAKLAGATLDWRWSAVPCEILRRFRGWSEHAAMARRLAFREDLEPYDWRIDVWGSTRLAQDGAFVELARYVRPGDNAPGCIRQYASGRAT